MLIAVILLQPLYIIHLQPRLDNNKKKEGIKRIVPLLVFKVSFFVLVMDYFSILIQIKENEYLTLRIKLLTNLTNIITAAVVQLVERWPRIRKILGLNPATGVFEAFSRIFSHRHNQVNGGMIPLNQTLDDFLPTFASRSLIRPGLKMSEVRKYNSTQITQRSRVSKMFLAYRTCHSQIHTHTHIVLSSSVIPIFCSSFPPVFSIKPFPTRPCLQLNTPALKI